MFLTISCDLGAVISEWLVVFKTPEAIKKIIIYIKVVKNKADDNAINSCSTRDVNSTCINGINSCLVQLAVVGTGTTIILQR